MMTTAAMLKRSLRFKKTSPKGRYVTSPSGARLVAAPAVASNHSLTISGIAISKPMDVTSFASSDARRRYRKSSISNAMPMSGAMTPIASNAAAQIGHSCRTRAS